MSFALVNQIARDSFDFTSPDKIPPNDPRRKPVFDTLEEIRRLQTRLDNINKTKDAGVFASEAAWQKQVNALKVKINNANTYLQELLGEGTVEKTRLSDVQPKTYSFDPQTNVELIDKNNINIYSTETNEFAKLSNPMTPTFEYEGRKYRSVEHAYQSLKSGQFDETAYRAFLNAPNSKRPSQGTMGTDKDNSISLMKKLYKEMLNQNPEQVDLLLKTGNANLTHIQDKTIWKDEFPKMLMELRDEFSNTNTVKPVERVGPWTRAEVEADKNYTYLFGDNTADRASGVVPTQTQAVIRGLDNAVGIDTRLSRTEDWVDTDANYNKFTQHVDEQIQKALDMGKPIKVSAGGMGTGKAKALPPRFKEYLDNAIRNIGTSNTSRIVPKGTPGSVLAMRGGDLPNPFYYQGGGPDAIVKISEGSTDANIAKVVELHKNWLETGAVPDGLTDDQIKRLAEMRTKQLNVIDNLPDNYKLGYYKPDATTSHAITLDNFIQERKRNTTQFNQVSPEADYPIRTKFNAENAAITIDFTTDATKGSGATKKSVNASGNKYQAVVVDSNGLMKNTDNIDALAKVIADNLTSGQVVNIAGHGAYKATRLGSAGFNEAIQQSVFDNELNKIFDRVKFFIGDKPITGKVISGGQSGYDEAGIKAARKIGVPTQVNYTGEGLYRPPEATGAKDDINNREAFRKRFERYGPGGMPPIDTPEFEVWSQANIEGKTEAEILSMVSKETGVEERLLKQTIGDLPGWALVPLEQAIEVSMRGTKAAPLLKGLIRYELGAFAAMIIGGASSFAASYAQQRFGNMQMFANLMPGSAPNQMPTQELDQALTKEQLDTVLFQDEEGNDFTMHDLIKYEAAGNAGKVMEAVAKVMPSYYLDEWLFKKNPEFREEYGDKKFFSEGGWRASLAQPALLEKGLKQFVESMIGLSNYGR